MPPSMSHTTLTYHFRLLHPAVSTHPTGRCDSSYHVTSRLPGTTSSLVHVTRQRLQSSPLQQATAPQGKSSLVQAAKMKFEIE